MKNTFRSTVSIEVDFEADFSFTADYENGEVKVKPESVISVRLLDNSIVEKTKDEVKKQLEEKFCKKSDWI